MRKPTTGQARTQAARKKPAFDELEKASNEFAVAAAIRRPSRAPSARTKSVI